MDVHGAAGAVEEEEGGTSVHHSLATSNPAPAPRLTESYEQKPQYGDQILECIVHLSQNIHSTQNQRVLQSACALLNSGGGVLHMHNVEHAGKVQSKDLDTWWSGMESNLADILSGDDLCNYFDFIGNFDDPDLFLFVKTAEHICTISYHCRLPTDTATHSVTYSSAAKLLSKKGEPSPLTDLPAIPTEYRYGQIEETLKQEGKQIQFKLLVNNQEQAKSFADKIRQYCIKYISAFANHYGGHIYFGIEDSTSAVKGEAVSADSLKKITRQVQRMMDDVIWGDADFKAEQGKHWDVHIYPVINCPRREHRHVVVVSVCKFPGGVFTSCPESFVVGANRDVRQLSFSEWKEEVLNQSRARAELHNRFMKVPLHTPFSRLHLAIVLQIAFDVKKGNVLLPLNISTGVNIQPHSYLNTVSDGQQRTCIHHVLSTFADETHVALPLQCWGTHLQSSFHEDMRTTLFILSQHYGLHLVFFVTSDLNFVEMWRMAQAIAVELKRKLVCHGGCVDRLGCKVHLLNMSDPLMLENFQVSVDTSIYPPTYILNPTKMGNIISALLIAIASYMPCETQSRSEDYHFLLTCDQLELLWTRQFTKELWIHGPPGAGKTVAALEMIKELIRRGCQQSQVLYLAENPLLCTYISSFNLCTVASRRELMQDYSTPEIFAKKYKDVRNMIVDEAQNFKDRDGDWYSLAEKLSSQDPTLFQTPAASGDNTPSGPGSKDDVLSAVTGCQEVPQKKLSDLTAGYFWVFMDYAQKVHKFKAGLPGLIGKNNFMLSEVSRNSKEIFDYAMKFMSKPSEAVPQGKECISDAPVLGHSYENGRGVEVVKCKKDTVHRTLFTVLDSYLKSGIRPDDIAILVSKQKETDALRKSVKEDIQDEGEDKPDARVKDVTVDTVRRFSGLDKPVIIGLDPHANTSHADLDKLIVNLATRAKDGLVIITTSDELLRKLQDQQ
ncbi:hypothetical protein BaRGS_00029818 [Batillaria attramentaria]|uniref:Uncharacterized protein n=1 Tax=Batillaria attramentaria TaxID=370345 RepID=A0ABD0JW49_9CAEN